MSAQDYYGGNSSAQGAPHQQHAQQGSNPYGYPQGSTPQPYYGQNEGAPHGGYSQQPYPSYDYQNQQSGGYGTQSYNYQHQHQHQHQQQQQQPYAPPAYDNLYPPAQHHDSDQKAPSHEQYTNQYDSSRQQGYDLYGQPSQYGPNVSVPPHEVRAGTYSQMDPNAPTGPEGERGLMGALAGGALGAYGGHKMGHGVLGALGGAYAGHKLEDAVKDKKKEKKHKHGNREERRARREERRRHRRERRGSRDSSSSSSSSSSDSDSDKEKRKHGKYKYAAAGAGAYAASHHSNRDAGRHGGYAGNFSGSASNITLDRDYDLIALCVDRHGKEKLSSIDLNDCLTNEWGHFGWARGGNAFASAKNAHLIDGGRVLEADLADGRGGWNRSRIVLDERIGNEDGELVLV